MKGITMTFRAEKSTLSITSHHSSIIQIRISWSGCLWQWVLIRSSQAYEDERLINIKRPCLFTNTTLCSYNYAYLINKDSLTLLVTTYHTYVFNSKITIALQYI